MKTRIEGYAAIDVLSLRLWVSNMDTVGLDYDGTRDYLRAAGAADVMRAHPGVTLDGQILIGTDPDAVWAAYVALREAVTDAGHGVEDEDVPAPVLTVAIETEPSAARSLEQACSPNCQTWDAFCREAMVERRS